MFVPHGVLMEFAQPATKDTISATVFAFSLISTAQLIWVARDGTGTIKNVSNVQQDGLWEPMEFVLPLMMLAQLGELMEPAQPATRVTILIMEFAFLPQLQDLKISDVKIGIGTIKNVLNALQDGLSDLTECVCQSVTTVLLLTNLECAQLAITDMHWQTVNVKFKMFFARSPKPMEHANHATTDTSFTENNVFQFQNLPALLNIMLPVAQKNSLHFKNKVESIDNKIDQFIYINFILFQYLIIIINKNDNYDNFIIPIIILILILIFIFILSIYIYT
jgi:hypothetical protein